MFNKKTYSDIQTPRQKLEHQTRPFFFLYVYAMSIPGKRVMNVSDFFLITGKMLKKLLSRTIVHLFI